MPAGTADLRRVTAAGFALTAVPPMGAIADKSLARAIFSATRMRAVPDSGRMNLKSHFLMCIPLLFTLALAACAGTDGGNDDAAGAAAAADGQSTLLIGRPGYTRRAPRSSVNTSAGKAHFRTEVAHQANGGRPS